MFRLKNSLSRFNYLSLRTGTVLCSLPLLLSLIVFCDVISNASGDPDWKRETPFAQQFGNPPQRYDFAMASIAFRAPCTGSRFPSECWTGNVIIFGGATVENNFFYQNDTWLWNGSNWIDLTPRTIPSARPPGRGFATMAFDQNTNSVVLFGGQNFSGNLGDTWLLNSNDQWVKANPSTSPPARFGAAMSYDERSHLVFLFGGQGGPKNTFLNDTWAWNGTTWFQVFPANAPSPRIGAAMVDILNVTDLSELLFGGFGPAGYLGDTYFYSTAFVVGPRDWTNLSFRVAPIVPPRADAAMAYYPPAGTVVLFGGSSYEPMTYVYDGDRRQVWNAVQTSNLPVVRSGARLAYHANSGRLVLFGGLDPSSRDLNDTWTWGKQVACLPDDGSTVPTGSTVRCFFSEDKDVKFSYWITDSFSPRISLENNKTFHTEEPGPASITAIWSDSAGSHAETFHFTIKRGQKDRDDDRDDDRDGDDGRR